MNTEVVEEKKKEGAEEKKSSRSYLVRKSLNQLEKVAIKTIERSKELNNKESRKGEEKLHWLKKQKYNVEEYLILLDDIISETKELEKEWEEILSTVKKEEFDYEMGLYEEYRNKNEGLFGGNNKVRLKKASLVASLKWINEEMANIQRIRKNQNSRYEAEKEKTLEELMDKLATISEPPKLFKFNRYMRKWGVFISQFEELIDKRTDLSDAQKFVYLVGCLKGEARKVIGDLAVNEENYLLAMEILRKRYGSKERRVIESYIRLQRLCYSRRNSSKLIKELLDILSQLKGLGENLNTELIWSAIISKLPNFIAAELMQKKLEEPEWNIENTLKFLKDTLDIDEILEMTRRLRDMNVEEVKQPPLLLSPNQSTKNFQVQCFQPKS